MSFGVGRVHDHHPFINRQGLGRQYHSLDDHGRKCNLNVVLWLEEHTGRSF